MARARQEGLPENQQSNTFDSASNPTIFAPACVPDEECPASSLDVVQGWTELAPEVGGAVRGAEHRSQRRKWPEGARRWIAALAQQYTDVLSAQPGAGEKRRGVWFAGSEPNHRVRRLAFLPTFWANAKSRRLPVGETKLCTRVKKAKAKTLDSGLTSFAVESRRNDELNRPDFCRHSGTAERVALFELYR
jgi:hypothetical protein